MTIRTLAVCALVGCVLPFAFASGGTCSNKGDRNDDCRIDLQDFRTLAACLDGPTLPRHPSCVCHDQDDDGSIDMSDFAAFQTAFTGENLIPGCSMQRAVHEPGPASTPPAARDIGPIPWMAPESIRDTTYSHHFSGEVISEAVDLHIRGRGIDFIWARTYRSQTGTPGIQGNGWDYSYNVRVIPADDDLILQDGNGRSDLYRRQEGVQPPTWCAPGFFREISVQANASLRCVFPGRGFWEFHPLDGSPRAGRMTAIEDANGNRLTLNYNPGGLLTSITDTLGRNITVGYNAIGQIETVTDFTGRQIVYSYYLPGNPDGNAGDLQSVRSPIVSGTPNGNDFPSGKTTTYTYATGTGDFRLDGNLLTITDPLGQTYLRNEYASTTHPGDPLFDHVVRQRLGNVGDVLDYHYASQTPQVSNDYAIRRTIVNDRNGHVQEYFYDKFNRCVTRHIYTGTADPNQPTTALGNRPTGKLRPGDPTFFETRYAYNDDSLLRLLTYPEGNTTSYTYASDLDPLAAARTRSNMVEHRVDPGPRGGDQPSLVTCVTFNPLATGQTNQASSITDPSGNTTTFTYDANGNRTRTVHRIPGIVEDWEYNAFGQCTAHIHPDNGSGHRRRDEFTYYAAGPQRGYRSSTVCDAPGQALTTTYEYDAVGNITRVIDPRGNDQQQTLNALDQVVRSSTRPVDPNAPIRYTRDIYYDGNDNVVQIDVQNRDESGAIPSNAAFTEIYEYDILNQVTRATSEVDTGRTISMEYAYDGERNRVLIRSGKAVVGTQPTNTLTAIYDERDLLYRDVRATGDVDQSTSQHDYDGNGNRVTLTSGLEDSNPRTATFVYDGYDRIVNRVDAMGNAISLHYDANSNRVERLVTGELQDLPGSAANTRLSETDFIYDDMDRLTQVIRHHFDPAGQEPFGDGAATTTYAYSDSSHVLSVTDDNGHVSNFAYDDLNRLAQHVDAKGNARDYTYDENDNLLRVTETDKSDLGLPDEIFITDYSYDGLNRVVTLTDSSGNLEVCAYDSRGNQTLAIDARGNETRYEYDGMNRCTRTIVDLDGDGADGDGGDIVRRVVWDDNSLVRQATDSNGNKSSYLYDALNRCVTRVHADGTIDSYQYDVHDNRTGHTDANGSVITQAYDDLDRLTGRTIAVGSGVSNDTTSETYSYDGLNRLVSASDDDSTRTFTWTSLSDMFSDTLNGDTTFASYDGVGNRTTITYPSGRTLVYQFDALDRPQQILQGGNPVATYQYVGPDRVTRLAYPNGVDVRYAYDGVQGVPNPPQDFGVKQVTNINYAKGGGSIDSRRNTWDPSYNKTERRDTRATGPRLRHAYGYDAHNRLTQTLVEDGFGAGIRLSQYTLDGNGNRLQIGGFGGQVGPYTLDPNVPPADAQVNQYTSTPRDSRVYDQNGNLAGTLMGPLASVYEYDYADRLVAYENLLSTERVEYSYDALGNRISKRTVAGPACCLECRYRYGMSGEVIEETDPNGVVLRSYVHGARANEIVCVEEGGTIVYHHLDDVGNTIALTDSAGNVVERYEFDDFGSPTFLDPNGVPQPGSLVGNPYLFHGLRFDPETRCYVDGSLYLDPANGRMISRGSLDADGNGYTYARNNAWSRYTTRPVNFQMRGSSVTTEGEVLAGADWNYPNGGTRAQDYNSSRSNNGSSVVAAQDYNSSRSNNSSIIAPGGGGGGSTGGGDRSPAAQDYNSSRSNNSSSVVAAQDYNSSRSNNSSIAAPNGGSGGSGNGGRGVAAQDYNSSRSNNSSIAAPNGGGHVTVLKARDPHRGHVTVLKAHGGGGGHVTVLKARDPHRGHVTVLKSRDDGDGHVTVLKARGQGGGHVTVLKARGDYDGHVTVLKVRGPGGRGHGNALRTPTWLPIGQFGHAMRGNAGMTESPSTLLAPFSNPTIDPLRAISGTGHTRATRTCEKGKQPHRGHVTVLK